jgi:hypothetical protein
VHKDMHAHILIPSTAPSSARALIGTIVWWWSTYTHKEERVNEAAAVVSQ